MEERRLLRSCVGVFGFALLVHVGCAALAAERVGLSLWQVSVLFDGHLYMEIARSFPFPFSVEALDYTGQSPGYPALAALWRPFLPAALFDWGGVMLVASWIPAALAAVAFHLLCVEVGIRSVWPALLFVVGNPRWIVTGATAHAEALAMLLAVLTLLAFVRRRLGWCVGLLFLTVLTRYNAILLGLPIALGFLADREHRNLRSLLLLGAPLLALVGMEVYLQLRIPDHPGIWTAHSVFWNVEFRWPFSTLIQRGGSLRLPWDTYLSELTLASVAVYVLAAAVGLRQGRVGRMLAGWIGILVLFHASLSHDISVGAFTRLAILAWPAALLLLWRWGGDRLPTEAAGVLTAALAGAGVLFATAYVPNVARYQLGHQPYVSRAALRLDADEPVWIDFGAAAGGDGR